MGLVTTKEMFAKALKADYAIGAFNVNNMEIIQGIVEAAEEEKAALKAKKEAEKQAAQKMKEENGNTSEENVA